jgi:glycosyltransferase involved in cell wall biosynthesis
LNLTPGLGKRGRFAKVSQGKDMPPTVSVIIPVYNAENYIDNTLRSIFNQSFEDYEIIVIDDGSTDNTSNILKNYSDKIIYIHQENSGGPSSPRNRGIKISRGKYIAIFDSDDLMFKDKLKRDVKILDNNTDVSLVFSNFIVLENDKPWPLSWFEKENVKEIMAYIPKKKIDFNTYRFERPIYREILKNNFIGTSTVVLRKNDIIDVGLFDESLVGAEDRDVWLRFCEAGKNFAYTTDALSYYRLIKTSLSRQTKNTASRIDFYSRLLRNNLEVENRRIVKNRIGELYLQYGFALRNQKKFVPAILQNLKSLYYIDTIHKFKALIAIVKILILTFAPNMSKSLSKEY